MLTANYNSFDPCISIYILEYKSIARIEEEVWLKLSIEIDALNSVVLSLSFDSCGACANIMFFPYSSASNS